MTTTMNAPTLLHRMLADGFDIEAREGLLYVSPADRISDELRADITRHRAALLRMMNDPHRIDWFADVGLRERQS